MQACANIQTRSSAWAQAWADFSDEVRAYLPDDLHAPSSHPPSRPEVLDETPAEAGGTIVTDASAAIIRDLPSSPAESISPSCLPTCSRSPSAPATWSNGGTAARPPLPRHFADSILGGHPHCGPMRAKHARIHAGFGRLLSPCITPDRNSTGSSGPETAVSALGLEGLEDRYADDGWEGLPHPPGELVDTPDQLGIQGDGDLPPGVGRGARARIASTSGAHGR